MERKQIPLENGIELSFFEAGTDGPPLLLLHGITDGALSYKPMLEALAKNYHVYAVDFRGHGDSSKPGPPYLLEHYVADILEFLPKVAGQTPILAAGHSLGAMVAAHIAGHALHPLRGVFLEDPPLYLGDPKAMEGSPILEQFTMLHALLAGHRAGGGTEQDLAALMPMAPAIGDPTKTMGDIATPDQIKDLASLLHRFDYRALDGLVEGTGIGFEVPEDYLPNIKCPVHILAGNAKIGAVITADELAAAAGMIPDCTMAQWEDVGHIIHHIVPERILGEMQTFFARCA